MRHFDAVQIASERIEVYGPIMNSSEKSPPTNAKGVEMDGEKLRTLRALLGLKREELATRCEISAGYVSHIETGRRRPSPPVFARICDALGVSDRRVLLAEKKSGGKSARKAA